MHRYQCSVQPLLRSSLQTFQYYFAPISKLLLIKLYLCFVLSLFNFYLRFFTYVLYHSVAYSLLITPVIFIRLGLLPVLSYTWHNAMHCLLLVARSMNIINSHMIHINYVKTRTIHTSGCLSVDCAPLKSEHGAN